MNIAAIAFTIALLVRFIRTGGAGMTKMMGGDPSGGEERDEPASSKR